MPVLCEALSVIIRRDSIDHYFAGGWDKFLKSIPNATMCTDGELVRVGFMTPAAVGNYIKYLEDEGLQFKPKKKLFGVFGGGREKNDIVIVDQNKGPTLQCDWIEFGHFPVGDDEIEVAMCWLFEGTRFGLGPQIRSDQMNLSAPNGWTPGQIKSISTASLEDFENDLQYLGTEGQLEVFWDSKNEKKVYIPSTSKS